MLLAHPREQRGTGRVHAIVGHAKVDTTLNVCAQVIDGSLRRAADTVGSELFTIVHKSEETMLGHPPMARRPSEARAREREPNPHVKPRDRGDIWPPF
jgi:hypothetical protein